MFTIMVTDAKTISRAISVVNGIGLKLMGISMVGPLVSPLEMKSL